MLMSCNVQSWLSLLYTVAILLVQDGSVGAYVFGLLAVT